MSLVETIPSLPAPAHPAATLARHEIAGSILFAVSYGDGPDRRRRWFNDRSLALAHALEVAEQFALPLLDLTGDPE